jgi:hypothetical protein
MAIEKNIVIGADLSGLEKKLDELIDALKASQTQADKTADSINTIANTTKDIGDSAKDSQKGIKGLGTGFKGLGVAIKAAGIGLLLSAMEILRELFDNNQKTVDFFNTTFNTLQVAFSDFVKWIESNTGTFTDFFKSIFEDPLGAVEDLGNAIKDNIIERFNSLLDTLGFVGEAMKRFFEGDFKGALESVQNAGKEMLDVFTGIDGSADKIANAALAVGEYAKETIKQGAAMTEVNKAAEIAEVLAQGLIEKYDLQAEKLRQVRDDERLTIQERIKANEDLAKVLDEQEAAMLKAAQISLDKAKQDLALAPDNIEFINAKKQAETELAGVQAQVAGFRSEQLMNEMSLQRELVDLDKSKAENAQEVAEIEGQAAIDAETNLYKRIDLEEALSKKLYDDKLAQLEADKLLYKEGTQAYQDMVSEINVLNAERTAQEGEEAKKRRELEQGVQQARLQMTGDAIGALNDLAQAFLSGNEEQAKKAFQINKALGISQAVVNTAQAVTAALTAGGNPIKLATGAQFVEAGIAAATGAAQIATIARQQFQASGSVDTNIQTPTAPSTSPQFNIVGASGQNAILESLQANPMRAYVVGSDVTSQQELDRNRINQVSFP